MTLVPCESLTKEAQKYASEGQYDAAASMLENAKKLDQFDPHCRYELGYIELLRERYNEAIDNLEEVERLAPGWFQVRANLWLANELLNGRLPQKVLIGLQLFECVQVEAKDRLRVADDLTGEFPGFAMMHLERGKILSAVGRQMEAEQAFLRALECESDPDTRSRVLSQLACHYEPGEKRNSYARQTLEITNGNLMAECIARLILQVDKQQ